MYEELCRLGVWDFAIDLSGADLPLRSIEDLSFALAPYRNESFFGRHGLGSVLSVAPSIFTKTSGFPDSFAKKDTKLCSKAKKSNICNLKLISGNSEVLFEIRTTLDGL